MSENMIHLRSVSQIHEMSGLGKPTHPLIAKIDACDVEKKKGFIGTKINSHLYSIGLKDRCFGLQYGRNSYDFDEGVLYFTAPNQIQAITDSEDIPQVKGWMIVFHPDLIRNTNLGKIIDSYKFFEYDVHEALHLSDDEQQTLTGLANQIEQEISKRIDNHSQKVICSYLELLLNLSKRYYERQFNTRSSKSSDIISQFQFLLKDYYESGKLSEVGTPSSEYFSKKVHLSTNYLSDLLKKETGQSTKDHISTFIINKAKTLLLGESDSIREIAYNLGFNYPHYFSRLFKNKTGMTPQEYRQLN